MRPTLSGIVLLLLPSLLLGTGIVAADPVLSTLAFGLSAALVILDGTIGASSRRVQIARQVEARLSVGAEAKVTLNVRSQSRRRLDIHIRDGVPLTLNPKGFRMGLVLEPGAMAKVSYHLRPDRRGSYLFDDVWVETGGLLGLARRQHRLPCVTLVWVVPDIRALRAWDLLARKAMTREAGFRALRRIGEGSEVERLREYESGDDYRRIDWKATARRQRPITREMEAERRRQIVFLVDCGRWMAQPMGRLLKVDCALNAVLLAAHVADRAGDLSGALTFSDRVLSWIPPDAGRAHQMRMLEELNATPADPVEPSFTTAFRHLASRQRRRALIILFSDFADPTTARALLQTLPIVSRRHLLLCIHLLDPELEALADLEPYTLRDVNRRALADQLRHERRRTLDQLRVRGAHVLESRADALTAGVVNRYLDLKGRGEL